MPEFYGGVREQAKRTNQSGGEAFHGIPVTYRERSGWWLVFFCAVLVLFGMIAMAAVDANQPVRVEVVKTCR